jgi:hypothetical protein
MSMRGAIHAVWDVLVGGLGDGLYELKTMVARYPMPAIPLQRLRGRGEVVGDTTDIVIEGFPRCASSFAVAAFRLAQEPRAMTIANHTHMPAQAVEGVRRGLPTLILIRPAEDAIVSLLIRSERLGVRAALRGYLRFYEPLVPIREDLVIATFDQVVNDLGSVIERVNARFHTAFAVFTTTEENLARIDHEIELDYGSRARSPEHLERIIPRPSAVREELRSSTLIRVRAEAPVPTRRRADAVYATLTS